MAKKMALKKWAGVRKQKKIWEERETHAII